MVNQLKGDDEDQPGGGDGAKSSKVKLTSNEQRLTRIEEALEQMKDLSARREKCKKGDGEKTRVSTTDPEARNMKMANGGFNPAFDVQFSSDMGSRIIMGVEVTNEGTDGN